MWRFFQPMHPSQFEPKAGQTMASLLNTRILRPWTDTDIILQCADGTRFQDLIKIGRKLDKELWKMYLSQRSKHLICENCRPARPASETIAAATEAVRQMTSFLLVLVRWSRTTLDVGLSVGRSVGRSVGQFLPSLQFVARSGILRLHRRIVRTKVSPSTGWFKYDPVTVAMF